MKESKIWFKVRSHDYMDMYPEYSYKLFNSKFEAELWEKYMRENYSGGTTHIVGYATQEEILKYINSFKDELDEVTLNNIYNEKYYKK